MAPKKIALISILLMLAACSNRWSPENYQLAGGEALQSKLNIGMSIDSFQRIYPDAKQLSSEAELQSFLVTDTVSCFMCSSAAGFKRSRDIFAVKVIFQNDNLISSKLMLMESQQ